MRRLRVASVVLASIASAAILCWGLADIWRLNSSAHLGVLGRFIVSLVLLGPGALWVYLQKGRPANVGLAAVMFPSIVVWVLTVEVIIVGVPLL